MPETEKVFEDRENTRHRRVEWFDDDGGWEIAIFSARGARGRAIRYADHRYGGFEEIELEPYRG